MIQKDNYDPEVFNQELSQDELASTAGGDLGTIVLSDDHDDEEATGHGFVRFTCSSGVSNNHK